MMKDEYGCLRSISLPIIVILMFIGDFVFNLDIEFILFMLFVISLLIYFVALMWQRHQTSFQSEQPIIHKVTPVPSRRPRNYAKKEQWINGQIALIDKTPNVFQLRDTIGASKITYSDLLNCVEWKYKRLIVLFRDGHRCQSCGVRSELNHVHHRFYLKDHLPWEIENTGLTTLCKKCHADLHQREEVPVYRKSGGRLIECFEDDSYCKRCGGSGYIHQFRHVQNGVCFSCNGNKITNTIFELALRRIKINVGENEVNLKYEKCRDFLTNLSDDEFYLKGPFDPEDFIEPLIEPLDLDDLPF